MIHIKNKASIRKMEEAGKRLSSIFQQMPGILKPGISTLEIDKWISKKLKESDLVSQTKGYMGYKHVSCISVNDEVVHGVPAAHKVLRDGDLVKVDVCASWRGYCADMARAFFIGNNVSDDVKNLVEVAKQSLIKGIEQAKPGNRLSDISAAIQKEVEIHGYSVVRDFAGHGIGKHMHEDPEILNYGSPGEGPVLRPGMTFAIEPMITMGEYDVYITEDGWTVRTSDNSMAAHVEDTILITDNGAKVLTNYSTQSRKV